MNKPNEEIVADLIRETTSWASIELKITDQQTYKSPDGTSSRAEIRHSFIADHTGRKFYERSHCDAPEFVCNALIGYDDGKRCASIECEPGIPRGKQKSVTITKSFMMEQRSGFVTRPSPLLYHHVGVVPIHEAMAKAVPQGKGSVIGRECSIFVFPRVPGERLTQDLVYHLDAATSAPLRVAAFTDAASRRADRPNWVWEAVTLDKVQGFHFPLKSKYASYREAADAWEPYLVQDIVVDSLAYNRPHPASTFWPVYEPGVPINDLVARTYYFNTPDKKAPPNAAKSEPKPATEVPPIVAREGADGSAAMGAGLLGLGLIAMAVVLWFRRR